jgi:hypothetical protein
MNTIVFHFSSAGVTEYSQPLTGVSGDFSATADGIQKVSEQADAPVGSFTVPIGSADSAKKRSPICAHVMGQGEGIIQCAVQTTLGENTYMSLVNSGRQRKIVFGRGIRDNYLGFEFSNPGGDKFKIDQIDLTVNTSTTRRI